MTQTTGCWLFPKIWNVSDKKRSSREADKLNLDPVSADWKFSDFKVGVSAHFDVKSKFRARELRFGPRIAFLMGNSIAALFLPFWGKKAHFSSILKNSHFSAFFTLFFFFSQFWSDWDEIWTTGRVFIGDFNRGLVSSRKKKFLQKTLQFWLFLYGMSDFMCWISRIYVEHSILFFFCQKLLQPFLVRLGLKLGSIACYGMGRTSEGSKST